MIPKDEWRLLALAALGFMLSMFILANEPEGGEAAVWYIYLILFWVGTAIYATGNQGIKKNWLSHALFGAVFGGLFISLNVWAPSIFRLGFPNVIADARFWVVGIIAPIAEELAFRQGLYLTILRNRYSFIISTILCSVVFAAFHWYAYGLGTYSAAYIGAFTFSVIACWLTERTKDSIAAIVTHSAINLFLILSPFVIIGAN